MTPTRKLYVYEVRCDNSFGLTLIVAARSPKEAVERFAEGQFGNRPPERSWRGHNVGRLDGVYATGSPRVLVEWAE